MSMAHHWRELATTTTGRVLGVFIVPLWTDSQRRLKCQGKNSLKPWYIVVWASKAKGK